MEQTMENEMDTGIIMGYLGVILGSYFRLELATSAGSARAFKNSGPFCGVLTMRAIPPLKQTSAGII